MFQLLKAPPSTSYNGGRTYDEAFVVGMIQSDEPGYYETDKFGIRLETDIEVVEVNTPVSFHFPAGIDKMNGFKLFYFVRI